MPRNQQPESNPLMKQLGLLLKGFEEPIPTVRLMLLDPIQKEEPADKETQELVSNGINLVNEFYKQLTLNIYAEISMLFKGAHEISNELYTNSTLEKETKETLRSNLWILYREIAVKNNELVILKKHLATTNFDGEKSRYDHLSARDLTAIASVVACVLEEFKPKKVHQDIIHQLELVAKDICVSMKKRFPTDVNLSGIDTSMLVIADGRYPLQPNRIDKTWQGTALNAALEPDGNCIPVFYNKFIKAYAEGSKEEESFTQTKNSCKDTIMLYLGNYFDQNTNPYVGVVVDATEGAIEIGKALGKMGQNLWIYYGNPVFEKAIDWSTFAINQSAIEVKKISANKNVQEIVRRWSSFCTALIESPSHYVKGEYKNDELDSEIEKGFEIIDTLDADEKPTTDEKSTEILTDSCVIIPAEQDPDQCKDEKNNELDSKIEKGLEKNNDILDEKPTTDEKPTKILTDSCVIIPDDEDPGLCNDEKGNKLDSRVEKGSEKINDILGEKPTTDVKSSENLTDSWVIPAMQDPDPDQCDDESKMAQAKLLVLMEISENYSELLNKYINDRQKSLDRCFTFYNRTLTGKRLEIAKKNQTYFTDLLDGIRAIGKDSGPKKLLNEINKKLNTYTQGATLNEAISNLHRVISNAVNVELGNNSMISSNDYNKAYNNGRLFEIIDKADRDLKRFGKLLGKEDSDDAILAHAAASNFTQFRK